MVILDMTEDLIREDIHGISNRTPCRTLLALVTGLDFFKDAGLGLKMYRKGKIKLFPSKFGGGREIKEIFNAFEKREK